VAFKVNDRALIQALALPAGFQLSAVGDDFAGETDRLTCAPLGPLAAFAGNWIGKGFNTIFRPYAKVPDTDENPADAVLELNLTSEILSFASALGCIPNRGFEEQEDIFLNGVPYLQSINDVTRLPARGIHFEPGIWLYVPPTSLPEECVTLARMACIPHGTTINAQGKFTNLAGKPVIPAVDITPFFADTKQRVVGRFPSLIATEQNTFRIPQDLSPFLAAGTITQRMLTDPNTVLRDQIAHQDIRAAVTIDISTAPAAPLFGGGLTNIAFLLRVNSPASNGVGPNAQAVLMNAKFWIETVIYQISVPPISAGDSPLVLCPDQTNPPVPLVPRFLVSISLAENRRFAGGTITMSTTQIQYSQEVILNFDGFGWPHVSVASLVPADPIPVPTSLLFSS
jgi:hypothetical protein